MKDRDFRPMPENFLETAISGVIEIRAKEFRDERGSFQTVVQYPELYNVVGIDFNDGQWNDSTSLPGVIRAIHCEDQYKLVRAVTGQMTHVFVDLRPTSPTFMDHIKARVNADLERRTFLVPPGVGNCICVDGDNIVRYEYQVSSTYENTKVQTVAYDDPDLSIEWTIAQPIISDRDRTAPSLRTMFPEINFDLLTNHVSLL